VDGFNVNETTLKTLDPIAKDPRVVRVYKDEIGLWIELAPGWMSGRDTPQGHVICEESVRELWGKYRGIKSCECEQCAKAPTYTPPAQTIAGRPMIDLPVPNEKRALRMTRASRKQGEVDAIGHQGGSIHKWQCPSCHTWVKEEINRMCAECRERAAGERISASLDPELEVRENV
jgi:hypothetical protein